MTPEAARSPRSSTPDLRGTDVQPPADAGQAPPYETRYASTELGPIAYWDVGEGSEVLFLVHGLPTSKALFRDVIPALARGRRVIALDLINFGESGRLDHRVDHRQRALGIEAVREALGVGAFTLVAHDLGSSVAMDYLRIHAHRVERLVLMSSPVYPDFQEPPVVRLIRVPVLGPLLLQLLIGTLYRQTLRQGLVHEERLGEEDVRDFKEEYGGLAGKRSLRDNLWWGTPAVDFADYPEIIKAIRQPTLILHGGQDPFIPLEHAERLGRDIPHARLTILEDAGHFIPMDVPEAIAAHILAFLDERGAAPILKAE